MWQKVQKVKKGHKRVQKGYKKGKKEYKWVKKGTKWGKKGTKRVTKDTKRVKKGIMMKNVKQIDIILKKIDIGLESSKTYLTIEILVSKIFPLHNFTKLSNFWCKMRYI